MTIYILTIIIREEVNILIRTVGKYKQFCNSLIFACKHTGRPQSDQFMSKTKTDLISSLLSFIKFNLILD